MDVSKWPWSTWFRAGAANAALGSVGVATAVACSTVTCNAEGGELPTSKQQRPDAGSGSAASPSPSQTPCPEPVPTVVGPSWKAPAPGTRGACSTSDLAAIDQKLTDAAATFTDLFSAIPTDTCRQCVFSKLDDPNWQLFVWNPDMTHGDAFVNVGACLALAPGGSAACGSGAQDRQFCLDLACSDICADQQACIGAADESVCKTQFAEMSTGCGSAVAQLDAECGSFVDQVKIVCGSASSDGGTEAAADASGDAPDEGG